ncbi:outer membrane beta-barrel domain-containing protein [bacterium]|jgi:outer membrane beta-barrel protein|nr:outer membrane beta-barrel domain-containing protein [bacterium]
MMKSIRWSVVAVVVGFAAVQTGYAVETKAEAQKPAEKSLEDQLQEMSVPTNTLPPSASYEKLYSVQSRYAPMTNKWEFQLGIGKRTNQEFVNSTYFNGGIRYHLSDRWSIGVNGSYVSNSLTNSTLILLNDTKGPRPDVAYPDFVADLNVGYNLFYGKFRLSMDNVLYFDQYWTLGGGVVNLNTGRQVAGVVDAGFAFWLGKKGSVRIGVKDYIYNEKLITSQGIVNSFVLHLDAGIMLGGS